jgi:hypothetical protein
MFGLGHLDLGPLFYGLVIFVGLWSMWAKLTSWRIGSFLAEAFVFYLVFKLHGGTLAGGLAATVASLLTGAYIGWQFRRK